MDYLSLILREIFKRKWINDKQVGFLNEGDGVILLRHVFLNGNQFCNWWAYVPGHLNQFHTEAHVHQQSKAFKYWNLLLEKKRTNYLIFIGLLSHIFFLHPTRHQTNKCVSLFWKTERRSWHNFLKKLVIASWRIRVVPN